MELTMISRLLREAFPGINIPTLDNYYESYIKVWADIYAGKPPWRAAKRSGLHSRGERIIGQMNAAKAICDEFTALTFAEKVNITLDNPILQDYIDFTLSETSFYEQIQGFITSAYALGGGCMKFYLEDGRPCIDFLTADKMYPLSWRNGRIKEIAFSSQETADGKYITSIEKYSPGKTENLCFLSDNRLTLGKRISGSIPEVITGNGAGLFAVFSPASANHIDPDCPLGVSVFSGALDTLKALDIAFDSFMREFILGKKRIIVPAASIQTVIDPESGEMTRYFDADDEAFVALKTEDTEALKIADNTVALRIDEHVQAIEALYKMLCFQTGVSSGTFSMSNGLHYYTKTASEVMSQNAKSARTVRLNQNKLTETLKTTVAALLKLGLETGDIDTNETRVDIAFSDNVITADALK
ncbi:MAG: phage portal protein [Ruminococcus sp.]|jgi:A118 family predicted phage portal protein|nr:phage portal protein [Ruminococcus sp.]